MDIPSYLMGRSSGGKGATIEVVTELPETGEPNVIYLVPKQTTGDNDIFDEYIWVEDDWELIGSTAIDISGKQDIMQFSTMPTADSTTVGKIIQYTGTTNANYTNGYFYIGINDNGSYSWSNVDVQDLSDYQERLVSGTNIKTIDGLNMLGSGNINSIPFKTLTDNDNLYDKGAGYYTCYTNIALERGKYTRLPFGRHYIFSTGSYVLIFSYITDSYKTPIISAYELPTYALGTATLIGSYRISTFAKKTYIPEIFGISEYSTSTTYQVGDYVYIIDSGTSEFPPVIYKCNTANTTGTWNSSKWTVSSMMEYLNDTLIGSALGGSY